MDSKQLQDILGVKIPNALNSFKELEQSVAPVLAQVNANRDKMDPEQLEKFDAAMEEIKAANLKMREYGYKNNG